jgi:hypothetical protein
MKFPNANQLEQILAAIEKRPQAALFLGMLVWACIQAWKH